MTNLPDHVEHHILGTSVHYLVVDGKQTKSVPYSKIIFWPNRMSPSLIAFTDFHGKEGMFIVGQELEMRENLCRQQQIDDI